MLANVCKFVPSNTAVDVIHTTNFVTEAQIPPYTGLRQFSVYRVHYVMEGTGILHTAQRDFPLSEGDVFFTFPAFAHGVESTGDLKYMFVSFIGARGNTLMEQYRIRKTQPVYPGYPEAKAIWDHFFAISNTANLDIISESVLLYTLSLIAGRSHKEEGSAAQENILQIKHYIDNHYADPKLSLEQISEHFSYNSRYISAAFQKHMQLSIPRYITAVRLQNACALMERNHTCIKDVALKCGFSDPLYFSKVFKKEMRVSPTVFLTQQKTQKNNG